MYIVRFTGWKEGLKKISLTNLLREKADLSLTQAKLNVDAIINGVTIEAKCSTVSKMESLAIEANELGAICTKIYKIKKHMIDNMIEKFEKYIEENSKNGIFKSYIEIEEITGIEIHDVIKIIDSDSNFYMNRDVKFTTKKMYEKYRGFWWKFIDVYLGEFR